MSCKYLCTIYKPPQLVTIRLCLKCGWQNAFFKAGDVKRALWWLETQIYCNSEGAGYLAHRNLVENPRIGHLLYLVHSEHVTEKELLPRRAIGSNPSVLAALLKSHKALSYCSRLPPSGATTCGSEGINKPTVFQ